MERGASSVVHQIDITSRVEQSEGALVMIVRRSVMQAGPETKHNRLLSLLLHVKLRKDDVYMLDSWHGNVFGF